MANLKVLIVGPSITRSRGGIATVISDLVNAKNLYQVEIKHVVTHVEGSKIEKLIVLIRAILKIFQESPFNLIHIHVASKASIFRKSIFVFLGLLLRKPVIMHVHGSDFDIYFNNSPALVKKYIIKTFSKCATILVLSDYWKSYFQENIPHPNIIVLHNGVYADEFKECHTTPSNLFKFLFLGKLCQRKGVYDLLQAINILVNQQGIQKLKFFLAGNGDLEQVREIINYYNLNKHVQILGWVADDQKKELLRQVDTLILPSYAEGLPMAILEAMAGGKIIISSYTGGIPDLVGEENGFLIKPGDIDSLCSHISYVYKHQSQMTIMSINNMNKVAEDYNLSTINDQLFKIYYALALINFPQNSVNDTARCLKYN